MKIRCASVAEPMLTSMRPLRRAMSLSRTGSVAAARAAESIARDAAACPHAQAVRAAANVRAARWRCLTAQCRRAFVGGHRGRVASATLRTGTDDLESGDDAGSGPAAASARCHASRSESPRPAKAPASARCAVAVAPPVAAW